MGTWRQPDYKTAWPAAIVIEESDDGYRAALAYSDSNALSQGERRRAGDTLKGEARSSRGPVEVELISSGQAGHITFRGAAMRGFAVNEAELPKASTSTTIPTVSPLWQGLRHGWRRLTHAST